MLAIRFGDAPKKYFDSGRCTRWKSEKHTYGSYTYIPVEGSSRDYEAIAAPCHDDTLLFCGEATNKKHLGMCKAQLEIVCLTRFEGTVDSAYESGMREANRILGVAVESKSDQQTEQLPTLIAKL